MASSIYSTGLNINAPLTTVAQGIKQSNMVMQFLYPLVESMNYTGQIIEFDDSNFETVTDDRADAAPYPEVAENIYGQSYELNTKGFKRKIGRKEANIREAMGIDWGRRSVRTLMRHAARRHEIEAATIATTLGNYATSNRITLTAGSQWNELTVDPLPSVYTGRTAIATQAGMDPNVCIVGRAVFDQLIRSQWIKEHIFHNPSTQSALGADSAQNPAGITERALAVLFGVQSFKVCNVIQRTSTGNAFAFGKHVVLGYTNPEAIAALERSTNADTMPRISYSVNRTITEEEPSMGYTLVKDGQPRVLGPIPNDEDQYVSYLLDFDRKVVNTGVDRTDKKIIFGYFIQNAVA